MKPTFIVMDLKTNKVIQPGDRKELFLTPEGNVILHYNDGSGGIDYEVLDDVHVIFTHNMKMIDIDEMLGR